MRLAGTQWRSAVRARIAPLLPFPLLNALSRPPLVLTFYHSVTDERLPHVCHLLPSRRVDEFERDLDFLQAHYEALRPDDLTGWLAGDADGRRGFLVTFDDGLREAREVAAPILKRRGLSAIFFIVTACIDNRHLPYRFKASLLVDRIQSERSERTNREVTRLLANHGIRSASPAAGILAIRPDQAHALERIAEVVGLDFDEYLQRARPFMSSEQIRALADEGFRIGSHSVDHPHFAELSLPERIRQVRESCDRLARDFGCQRPPFAFPWGADGVSDDFYHAVRPLVSMSFGTGGLGLRRDLRLFDRVWLESREGLSARAAINLALARQLVRRRRHVS